MDQQNTTPIEAQRPRRRRKTKMEIFKEQQLPYIILSVATVLIVIFIIGALVRNANEKTPDDAANGSTTQSAAFQMAQYC